MGRKGHINSVHKYVAGRSRRCVDRASFFSRRFFRVRFPILLLSLVLFLIPSLAIPARGESVITFREGDVDLPIGSQIQYFEDRSANLSLEDVRDSLPPGAWNRGTADVLNFRTSSSAFWFRFEILRERESAEELFLSMGYPPITDITVHMIAPDGRTTKMQTGDRVPYDLRPVPYRSVHHQPHRLQHGCQALANPPFLQFRP